jgi:hypothetical protein
MKHRYLAATLVALLVVQTSAPIALAATTTAASIGSSQALEISPPVLELSGNPGETVKAQVSVRDVADTALIVKGQVNDFVAQGEDGVPKILLEEGEESPYSMKSWFSPLNQLTLQPKKIENLTLTINIPSNAAPGGYYSTIRFTANAPGVSGNGVALSASLGALVFMRVKGDAKEALSIAEFGTYDMLEKKSSWLHESAPINFVLRTKNEGNLHEQPVGQATIKDMFGNAVGLVNINLERKNVLPGSTRKFEAPLDKAVLGDRMLFGRYTADLVITYGTTNQKLTTSISFWVIPWKLIALVVVGLIGGFFLLRFGLKRYNDYILSKSPRRRR